MYAQLRPHNLLSEALCGTLPNTRVAVNLGTSKGFVSQSTSNLKDSLVFRLSSQYGQVTFLVTKFESLHKDVSNYVRRFRWLTRASPY